MRTRIGIALGGGAARGWAHIGVLRTLAAAGIVPDVIAGTSIGAVVGGCFAAGQLDDAGGLRARPDAPQSARLSRFQSRRLRPHHRPASRRSRWSDRLGDLQIERLARPFTAIATEIGTGNEIWLSRGKLVDAMRASYALPGIFQPVRVDGRWLFDGALVNPIPVVGLPRDGRALRHRRQPQYRLVRPRHRDPRHRSPTARRTTPPTRRRQKQQARRAQAAAPAVARRRARRAPGISTATVIDAFNIVQDRIARSRLAGDPPDCHDQPAPGRHRPVRFPPRRGADLARRSRRPARDRGSDARAEAAGRRAPRHRSGLMPAAQPAATM